MKERKREREGGKEGGKKMRERGRAKEAQPLSLQLSHQLRQDQLSCSFKPFSCGMDLFTQQ
jgi:hypothetical protein